MISALALTAVIATQRNEREYRVTVHGAANALVAVHAQGPPGWIEAVCTARTCGIGRGVVRLSRDGTAVALLHVYRVRATSPRSGVIAVRAGDGGASTNSAVLRYLRMTL